MSPNILCTLYICMCVCVCLYVYSPYTHIHDLLVSICQIHSQDFVWSAQGYNGNHLHKVLCSRTEPENLWLRGKRLSHPVKPILLYRKRLSKAKQVQCNEIEPATSQFQWPLTLLSSHPTSPSFCYKFAFRVPPHLCCLCFICLFHYYK